MPLLFKKALPPLILISLATPIHSKTTQPSPTPQEKITSCLYFDPEILKTLEKKTTDTTKQAIQEAIQMIQNGETIPPEILHIIHAALPDTNPDTFDDPIQLLTHIRQKLGIIPTIQHAREESIDHELAKKEQYQTSTKHIHYLAFSNDNETTLQDELDQRTKNNQKPYTKDDYIPLKELLETRAPNLPPQYIEQTINMLKHHLTLQRQLTQRKAEIFYLGSDQNITQDIEEIKQQLKKSKKAILKQFKTLNIPKSYLNLIKDHTQLKQDPRNDQLLVPVKHTTKEKTRYYGPSLIIQVIPDPYDDDDDFFLPYPEKIKKHPQPFANPKLTLKDYDNHQAIHYTLTQYLQIVTDDETNTQSYHIYYQTHHKKNTTYYKYTPQGIEVITKETFIKEAQRTNTHLLNYKKTKIIPFLILKSWWTKEDITKIKSGCTGAACMLTIWIFTSLNLSSIPRPTISLPNPTQYIPRIKYLPPPLKGSGGLHNLGNTCFWNAATQVKIDHLPHYLTETLTLDKKPNTEINNLGQKLIQQRNEGNKGNEGVSGQTIHDLRQAFYNTTFAAHLYNSTGQQDADEEMAANETLLDEKKYGTCLTQNQYTFTHFVIPRNVTQEETKAFNDYLEKNKTKINEHNFRVQLALPKPNASQHNNGIPMQQLLTNYSEPSDINFSINFKNILQDILKQNSNDVNKCTKKIKIYYLNLLEKHYKAEYEKVKKDLPTNHNGKNLKSLSINEFNQIQDILQQETPQNKDDYIAQTNPNRLVKKLIAAKKDNCVKVIEKLHAIRTLQKSHTKGDLNQKEDKLLDKILQSLKKFQFNIQSRDDLKKFLNGDPQNKQEAAITYDLTNDEVTMKCACTKQDTFAVTEECKVFRVVPLRFSREGESKESRKQQKNFTQLVAHNKNNIPITETKTIEVPVGFGDDAQKKTFELVAIVFHSGTSKGGHYTAASKHPIDQKWHYYNDTSDTIMEPTTLTEKSKDGYIYIYKKKEPEE